MQEGADLENAKSYDEALQAYRSAAKIDGEYAELEFRIARTLWKQGDYQGAKEHYRARPRSGYAPLSRRQQNQWHQSRSGSLLAPA